MFNNKAKQCKKKQTNTRVNDQEIGRCYSLFCCGSGCGSTLVLCTGSDQIAPGPAAQLSSVLHPHWTSLRPWHPEKDPRYRDGSDLIHGQYINTCQKPFKHRWPCFYPVLSVQPVLPFPTCLLRLPTVIPVLIRCAQCLHLSVIQELFLFPAGLRATLERL